MLSSFRATMILSAAILLPGCTIMGGEGSDEMIDRSIVTGSIAAPPPPPDLEQMSDSRTVRNAVSAANVASIDAEPLAWANADTGASGSITSIVEQRAGDRICRAFTTSRQRFDGVSLYAGEACTAGAGEWVLTRFSEGG